MQKVVLTGVLAWVCGCGGSTGTPQTANAAGSEGGGSSSTAGGSMMGGSATGGSAIGGSSTMAGSSASGGDGAGHLADVQAIFDERCVNCHDATKHGLPSFPQLPLTRADARTALVNKPATETCGGTLVVPGDPERSYLVRKLSDAKPCAGAHMPRPFEIGISPPLSAAQMDTIRAWIAAGAKP